MRRSSLRHAKLSVVICLLKTSQTGMRRRKPKCVRDLFSQLKFYLELSTYIQFVVPLPQEYFTILPQES